MLHGYYGSARANWYLTGIAQELAKTNQVIAMDIRGHGKSGKPRQAKFYGSNLWRDAVAVLDAEGVEQAHLHGFSMGGTLATQILYHHPERVLSITYGGSGIREIRAKYIAETPEDKMHSALAGIQETRAVARIIALTRPDVIALATIGRNMPHKGEKFRIDLTKVDIPVLAITGEYDFPNRRTHRLQRELKNFRNIIVPGKAHASLITPGFMPDIYLEESVQFIRSVDAQNK